MTAYEPVPKVKIVYLVGRGILYDETDGFMLFGNKELYNAFNFALEDSLRNRHLTPEIHKDIAQKVKGLFNEMWYKLREGSLWQRVLRNPAIIEEYREKLRQDPAIVPFLKDAENFLRSNKY